MIDLLKGIFEVFNSSFSITLWQLIIIFFIAFILGYLFGEDV